MSIPKKPSQCLVPGRYPVTAVMTLMGIWHNGYYVYGDMSATDIHRKVWQQKEKKCVWLREASRSGGSNRLKFIRAGAVARWLGVPPLWHMCPESIQFQCFKLFNHIQFTVGTSVSQKSAKSKYFLKSTPSDQLNKEAFLRRRDHLLRFNQPL